MQHRQNSSEILGVCVCVCVCVCEGCSIGKTAQRYWVCVCACVCVCPLTGKQDLAPRLPLTVSLPVPRPLPSLTDSSSSLRTGAQGRPWRKAGRFLPSEERGRERPRAQEPHRALLGIRTPWLLSVSMGSPTLGTSCRWHHICPLGSGFSLST